METGSTLAGFGNQHMVFTAQEQSQKEVERQTDFMIVRLLPI